MADDPPMPPSPMLPPPTLAALRPPPGSTEEPVHRRTITMEVFQRDEYFAVVGTLHDERPWASGDYSPRQLHFMDLGLVVRRADMTIVDAAADMRTFPHAECTRHRAELPRPDRPVGGARATRAPCRSASVASAAAATWSSWPGPWGPSSCRASPPRPPGRSRTAAASTRCARGLQLPDQHLPRLDRGRSGGAEDRARVAAGHPRLSGARGGRGAPASGRRARDVTMWRRPPCRRRPHRAFRG